MRVKVIRVSPYLQSMIDEMWKRQPRATKRELEEKIVNYVITAEEAWIEEDPPWRPEPTKPISYLLSGKTVTTYHTGVTETTIELSEEGKRALTVPEGAFGSRRR